MNRSHAGAIAALALLSLASTPTLAQHETGADLFSGQQVWQNLCANCHGLDGTLVPNVDLSRGVFRQNYSDEQLVALIKDGIPNTPMPPNPNMSTEQAQLVVEYLRSRAVDPSASLTGNAANGRELYIDRGYCNYCHIINGEGEPTGPELSRIGEQRTVEELTQSLRAPSAVIQPNMRQVALKTSDGKGFMGRLMNQDSFSIQLMDYNGELHSIDRATVTEYEYAPSPMGALGDDWTDQEVADLVAYLASLRAPAPTAP